MSRLVEETVSKTVVEGSIPSIHASEKREKMVYIKPAESAETKLELKWTPILAAVMMVLAVLSSGIGVSLENWFLIANAGVLALCGLIFSVLSFKE